MTPILLEDHLEQAALQWLAGLGWEVAHGPDISPPDAHTHTLNDPTIRKPIGVGGENWPPFLGD